MNFARLSDEKMGQKIIDRFVPMFVRENVVAMHKKGSGKV
jgi:hypothetical protein